MKSRKTVLTIIGVVGVILTFFQTQFGLTMNVTEIVAGLTTILLYVLFEGKADIKRITEQSAKFKDPKFWLAFVSAMVVALSAVFPEDKLPVEIIIAILTFIMSLLFKKDALNSKV